MPAGYTQSRLRVKAKACAVIAFGVVAFNFEKMLNDFTLNLVNSLNEGVYLVDTNRVITFWNKAAERLTGFSAAEVVGHSCSDNILRHVDEAGCELCLGHCPLARSMAEGREHEAKAYLHHKNGNRLPVNIKLVPFFDEFKQVAGAAEVFAVATSRQELLRQLSDLQTAAFIDPLAQLGNRRYGEMILETRLQQWRSHEIGFGLLFADIDHFKQINDSLGHQVGDKVLKMVADTLSLTTRSVDCVVRWGGEEFVAILPAVEAGGLHEIAERLRAMTAAAWLDLGGEFVRGTISVGGSLIQDSDDIERLIARADGLMYAAKHAGRNQVRLG